MVRRHVDASADPARRPLGTLKLRDLTVDRVADWSLPNERQLTPGSARITLLALNQICRFAVRRGWLADNPVAKLEPAEKPRRTTGQISILERHDLARLLDHGCSYRPVSELLAHTGLRIGEALGLTWADIDHDQGLIHVHRQLNRHREHAPLKTEASKRDVILAPAIAKLLRAPTRHPPQSPERPRLHHRQRPRTRLPTRRPRLPRRPQTRRHPSTRTALAPLTPPRIRLAPDRRRPQRRVRQPPTRPRQLHSLRHGYASLLIAEGLNVVFVSRLLGHANPTITLTTYAHLFERADHAEGARRALEASYAAISDGGG